MAEPAQFFARRPESLACFGRLFGRSGGFFHCGFAFNGGFFHNSFAFDGSFFHNDFNRRGFHVDFYSRSFFSFFGAGSNAHGQNGGSSDSNNLLHDISPSRNGAAMAAPDEWARRPFESSLSAFLAKATDFVHVSSTAKNP